MTRTGFKAHITALQWSELFTAYIIVFVTRCRHFGARGPQNDSRVYLTFGSKLDQYYNVVQGSKRYYSYVSVYKFWFIFTQFVVFIFLSSTTFYKLCNMYCWLNFCAENARVASSRRSFFKDTINTCRPHV
jgi:hypothetical protein